MKVLSLFSYRENVGKTTLASCIALKMYEKGYNVGILDFDLLTPGGLAILFDRPDLDQGVADTLLDNIPLKNIIIDISPNRELDNKLLLIPAVLSIEKIIRILREGCSFRKLKSMLSNLEDNLDVLIVDTHAGFSEDTITMLTLSNLVLLVLRYDYQDIIGAKIAVSIFKRMEIPVISVVNMVPGNIPDKYILDYIESKIGIRPILAIPLYEELLEFMTGRSVQNILTKHKGFSSSIERLTSSVEVKLNE